MATTTTGFIIIGVVIVLAGAAYLVHALETQRQQKRLLAAQIRSDIRYAEQIFAAIPALFINEALHRFLLQFIHSSLLKLSALGQAAAKDRIEYYQQRLEQPFQAAEFPLGSLTCCQTEAEAQQASAAIKELARWLNTLNQQAMQGHLNELLHHCKHCFDLLAVDGIIFKAQALEQTKGPRVALPQYDNCLNELDKMDHYLLSDRQSYELRTHIAQLQATLADESGVTP